MKTNAILSIKNLSASFSHNGERKEVLHDIDLRLNQGETLGIVGESGSGKSVTSMSIMRLIPSPPINYDSGEIIYGESAIDLLNSNEASIRKLRGAEIAMIFQEPMTSLNPLKRCGEQVAEALRLHLNLEKDEANERVISLFEQVKLPDPQRAAQSYPHQLSGGQKQRVMIAMAISCNPKLLIADEPTTALDVTVQRDILNLLAELQADNGMSMIFISHDLAVVGQVADNILVMHKGNPVEYGKAGDVLNSPREQYTKGLLSSRPPSKTRPKRLSTVADFLDSEEHKSPLESIEERQQRHQSLYNQEALLSGETLHVWYPNKKGLFNKTTDYVKAVNGLSFKLYPGETLGVVGESGCGKSTLGRSILGLEKLQSGSLLYRGTDVSTQDKKSRKQLLREVQMIFQDPYSSLNPKMTIGQAIVEPMEVHKLHANNAARKEKALELLDKVGLESSHFDRYPHEFSGGQRQRICIARTLALEPKVIICDESVSALDVSVQAQVLNLLNDLKQEFQLSYIFISHDLSVVRYMSDKVLVMNQGKVMEYREADDLYQKPEDPYTQKLISSAYSLDS